MYFVKSFGSKQHCVVRCWVGSRIIALNDVSALSFVLCSNIKTLRSDKVSMLTFTYPHKPLGKIKVAICNLQVAY